MDILKKCQEWNEHGEFEMIIRALENLPENKRTPQTDCELARAYNNLAGFSHKAAQPEDRKMLEKALELLLPHEKLYEKDHLWNFRTAYAYYYLDLKHIALYYFERALEACPGNKATLACIEKCKSFLSLPKFQKNFRERTKEAWDAFVRIEPKLREIMDEDTKREHGEEMVNLCKEAIKIAFCKPAFELGFNGEKYELILSAEGNNAYLFPLVYFKKKAPESIMKNWNILVGRQSSRSHGMFFGGRQINGDDVSVQTEKISDHKAGLTLYCEKLIPLIKKDKDHAVWMLTILTDQILGEIASIDIIGKFNVVDAPIEGGSVLLSELPEALEKMGIHINNDAEYFLEHRYANYQTDNPNKDPEAPPRFDVYYGSTRLPALIDDYLKDTPVTIDEYNMDGITAGYISYPLGGLKGESSKERGKAILGFRDSLEAAILAKAGEEAVTFLGGATGIYCGYLDFLAWDLKAVLDAASEFLQTSDLPWADFRTFRRDVYSVPLLNREKNNPDNQ